MNSTPSETELNLIYPTDGAGIPVSRTFTVSIRQTVLKGAMQTGHANMQSSVDGVNWVACSKPGLPLQCKTVPWSSGPEIFEMEGQLYSNTQARFGKSVV